VKIHGHGHKHKKTNKQLGEERELNGGTEGMNMRPREFCDKFKKGFCPTRNSLVPESIPIVTPPIYPYPLLCSFRDNLTSPLLSLLPSPLSLLSHSHSPFSHSHSPHSPSAIPTRALLPLPHITLHHRIIPLTEPAQEFSSVYFTDHSLSAPLSHIHTAHLFCFPSSFFFFLFLLLSLSSSFSFFFLLCTLLF